MLMLAFNLVSSIDQVVLIMYSFHDYTSHLIFMKLHICINEKSVIIPEYISIMCAHYVSDVWSLLCSIMTMTNLKQLMGLASSYMYINTSISHFLFKTRSLDFKQHSKHSHYDRKIFFKCPIFELYMFQCI